VGVLRGIYSFRFGEDPELMAEWDAVWFLPTRPQVGSDSKLESPCWAVVLFLLCGGRGRKYPDYFRPSVVQVHPNPRT
jgi:hypothetical protein